MRGTVSSEAGGEGRGEQRVERGAAAAAAEVTGNEGQMCACVHLCHLVRDVEVGLARDEQLDQLQVAVLRRIKQAIHVERVTIRHARLSRVQQLAHLIHVVLLDGGAEERGLVDRRAARRVLHDLVRGVRLRLEPVLGVLAEIRPLVERFPVGSGQPNL